MNKTKVLVFTCYDKWNVSLPNSVKIPEWTDSYPVAEHPIKECVINPDSSTFKTLQDINIDCLGDKTGVFLVYDDISTKGSVFKKLKQYDGQDLYILAHTTGNCKPESFVGWEAFVLEGSHKPDAKFHYTPLFEILTDDQPDKLNRIINTIFKPLGLLELVLKFLHQCLFAPKSKEELNKLRTALLKRLPDNSDAKKALRDYTTNTDEKFEELRDKLLEFALNNH